MTHCIKMGLIMLYCLMTAACATNRIGTREEFEQSMKAYNRMLRWHEVENAGMVYVGPELRDAFMKAAAAIKKRGVTITDYRILTSECLPEKGSAEVIAEFDYYSLPSVRIKTVTYRQLWTYRETGEKKSWKLESGLPQFE
jgi:hypothetical protein